ncbi:MAG: putative toxin-antitoxin system toxin component, PIN family [Verrucomicrobia bacterium]|nr:putative toxin-antitoxin system toxin component, PIN family [Verrucomicrobiota bacterium]
MRVVFDAGVVLAGAGWRHEAHHCLVLAAKRIALPYATSETLDELQRVARRMEAEGWFKKHDPWPTLKWYLGFARRVEPAPLGQQRSRDVKDDPYLACALASRARFLISRDSDLLALGKPFGIEILTPRAFLSRVAALF